MLSGSGSASGYPIRNTVEQTGALRACRFQFQSARRGFEAFIYADLNTLIFENAR